MSHPYLPVEGVKWLATRDGVYYLRKDSKNISLRTRDHDEAMKLYVEKLGRPVAARRDVRVRDAWEMFVALQTKRGESTMDSYKGVWRRWCADLLDHMLIHEVEPRHIYQVVERAQNATSERTGEPLSKTTLVQIRSAMSAMFKFFMVEPHRYCVENPTAFIEVEYTFTAEDTEPVDPEQVLSWEEIEQIANAFGDWANVNNFKRRTVVKLMPSIGTRISETLALTTKSLVPDRGRFGSLLIKQQVNPKLDRREYGSTATWFKKLKGALGKAGSEIRYVPLGPETRQLWDTYLERGLSEGWIQPGGLMFPNERGFPFAAGALGTEISEVAEKTIGRRIVSHWFRHTYASDQFADGASHDEVARLLGNSADVCEKVYIHFVGDEEWINRVADRSR